MKREKSYHFKWKRVIKNIYHFRFLNKTDFFFWLIFIIEKNSNGLQTFFFNKTADEGEEARNRKTDERSLPCPYALDERPKASLTTLFLHPRRPRHYACTRTTKRPSALNSPRTTYPHLQKEFDRIFMDLIHEDRGIES